MTTAVLTANGQLQLPRIILERLGLHQGDKVELRVESDGSLRVRRAERSATDNVLDLCHAVYEGLSDAEVDEIESIALDRSRFRTRPVDV
ncbi:MAG: hypothetical protein AAGC60_02780 [Acidobacteriota bacterium]